MNIDISYYVSVFMRRLHIFLVVALAVGAAAFYVAMTLPAMYNSSARLLVEGAQIPENMASSTVNTSMSEQLAVIEQRLTTRENLLDIARDMNVFEGQNLPVNEIVQRMRSQTSIRQSGGSGGANILTVSFDSEDPAKAASVANEFVTRILEQNSQMRNNVAGDTLAFFQDEVERLGEELDQISSRIVDFQNANRNALPSGNDYRMNRQSAQQERLVQIDRELAQLRDQRQRLVEAYESGGDIGGESQLSAEERELRNLREQLDDALAVYSESNPRVRVLQTRVSQMEEQLAQNSDGESVDPREAAFEMQMAEIEGRADYLEEQRVSIEQELEQLGEQIAATPENAIVLSGLEREYSNVQTQYNNAVSRLAQAATGERIELNAKGQRISVIEQATEPNEPTSPDRAAIAAGGAFAGIALGAGLVLLMEFLNRSIRRPVDLQNRLGITPLVTLPYIRTERELMIKRLLVGLMIAAVVIGVPALLFALHTFYLPLDLLFERITEKLLS